MNLVKSLLILAYLYIFNVQIKFFPKSLKTNNFLITQY